MGVDSDEVGLVYNGQKSERTLHNLFPNTDEHKSEKSMVTTMSVAAIGEKQFFGWGTLTCDDCKKRFQFVKKNRRAPDDFRQKKGDVITV